MDLGCGTKCMKYILFVINFLFFLLGAAAFGLGIWALVDKNKMNVLTKVGAENSDFNVTGLLESAAIVLLVGGGAILLIGFLGCCGAFQESTCLLFIYGILLVVILIIQLTAIIIAAVFKGKVKDEMEEFLKKAINTTYEGKLDTAEEFSLGLDFAQVYFHCCGIDSYQNFYTAQKWNRTVDSTTTLMIPPSCCKFKDDDKFFDEPSKAELVDPACPVTGASSYKDEPCWDSIKDYLENRIAIVIGIAAGIIVLEVACLVFACCIISVLRKEG